MYDCSRKISLGTGGSSLQKTGSDNSDTNHSCPVDAQGSNSEKYTSELKWQDAQRTAYPASTNPELLTIHAQKNLDEEIQQLAMQTHLEVQQREDIRRYLAERMKFVPPDIRAREHVSLQVSVSTCFLKARVLRLVGILLCVSCRCATESTVTLWQSANPCCVLLES